MDSKMNELDFRTKMLKTQRWVVRHRVPAFIQIRMKEVVSRAPREIFDRSTESVCRYLYTEAMKNG